MLDTADNLSRCLSNIPKEGFADKNAQTLLEAVTMIEKEYLKILEKNQIIKFNPQGEKFDPNTMNALMQVPSAGKIDLYSFLHIFTTIKFCFLRGHNNNFND